MLNAKILDEAKQTVALLCATGRRLCTAESCTGGLIAAAITSVPGASAAFHQGYVTYSDSAKTSLLKVAASLLRKHGAVSLPVAAAMATGAARASQADISISVTGVAGPGGGSDEKPVGTVFIAVAAGLETPEVYKCSFTGTREEIRTQIVCAALQEVRHTLQTLVLSNAAE